MIFFKPSKIEGIKHIAIEYDSGSLNDTTANLFKKDNQIFGLAIVTAKMNIRNNQGIQESLHLFSIISRNEFGLIITFMESIYRE
jgi:hypothetical protein